MALQSSGAISLNDLHIEVGGTSGTTCSLNDPDIRALIDVGDGAGQSIQQYYGKSSETSLPTGGSTVNGQVQLKQITASTYISSGGTLRIPSNMWVWSDDRTVAALTIDIPCTIINDGKIIGKGGRGGSKLKVKNAGIPTTSSFNSGYNVTNLGSGSDGGPAIKINSGVSGVTITNSSGAFIAGGGGGGGSSTVSPGNTASGGGGGAGGADGGFSNFDQHIGRNTFPYYTTNGPQYSSIGILYTNNNVTPSVGFGGQLNERGYKWFSTLHSSGNYYDWTKNYSYGGNAGGPGSASAGEDQGSAAGFGGGRILPGTRVNSPSYGSNTTVCYGGAGGEAGGNGNSVGGYSGSSGGGGGWGSAGGRGYRGAFTSVQCQGGTAGKAVDDSGVSYTLSNSGTIYGGT